MQCLDLSEEELKGRTVDHLDIAFDEFNPKHYKIEEDPKFFKSIKTSKFVTKKIWFYVNLFTSLPDRGPLMEGWRETDTPIMCSYKVVHASFEVWGLQTRVEDFIQRAIRDILLLGHRQAFVWVDEWHGMTMEDVRAYERQKQAETNEKVQNAEGPVGEIAPPKEEHA